MENILTKVDWNAFQYIFSGDARGAFQRLAEQMFCFEFKQPYGIYRYYNQPYIETMPILHEGLRIGFQSKYFDANTNFADKRAELTAAISGAYKRYPGINKIVFYVNRETGMGTTPGQEKSAYIREVESHASNLGIAIEWRGLNQIETMLLHPEMQLIRDYFFHVDGGIRQFLSQIEQHKCDIFESIHAEIPYDGRMIKINRMPVDLDSFFTADKDILVVSGKGGCGKSGLIKDQLSEEKGFPVWLFRATDLDCDSIPAFSRQFGECTWETVLSAFDDAPKKLFVIDSVEKAFSIEHLDTLESVIRSVRKHGWKLLVTIRTEYEITFLNTVLETSNVAQHCVPPLAEKELSAIAEENGISLPTNESLWDFLSNLFYLRMYLSKSPITAGNIDDFLHEIWEKVICNTAVQKDMLHIWRGQTICALVQSNADMGTAYYVPPMDANRDAISALVNDGIIQCDEVMGGFFITHDVYEEIVLQHMIQQEYTRRRDAGDVFQAIGNSLMMRKAFRAWLHKQLKDQETGIKRFLTDILMRGAEYAVWKDEILVALMSEENDCYPDFLEDILKDQKYTLFIRALNLLNTACNVVDDTLLRKLLSDEERKRYSSFRFTRPAGYGWEYLISFTYKNREKIPWTPIVVMLAADALYEWVRHTHGGETTRTAGLMALYLYEMSQLSEYHYRLGDEKIRRICDAIFNSAEEIVPELTEIIESVIAKGNTGRRDIYAELCEHLLGNALHCGVACSAAPKLVIRLARFCWLAADEEKTELYYMPEGDEYFGLSHRYALEYYPSSAFQTPIFPLLQAAPVQTTKFIVELVDVATEKYKNSRLNPERSECFDITLDLPNGKQTVQTASVRLWQMYRGTDIAPHLLESMLMALERWLYQWISQASDEKACNMCVWLLSISHSAAITAVVTSMVTAYPDKLFPVACMLLHTMEIIFLENYRAAKEPTAGFKSGLPRDKFYKDERASSNSLTFRKMRLEDVIREYQFKRGSLSSEDFEARLNKLYQAMDETFSCEESLPEYAQFALYRIDMRRLKVVESREVQGKQEVLLAPDLPENLKQVQQAGEERNKERNKSLRLMLWSHARFEQEVKNYQEYSEYEESPSSALEDALVLSKEPGMLLSRDSLLYVCSVLLRDFNDHINEEARKLCHEIVISYLHAVIEQRDAIGAWGGTDGAVAALPMLMGSEKSPDNWMDDPVILLLMLICDWGKQRDFAVELFRKRFWEIDGVLAERILRLFVALKSDYDTQVNKHSGLSPFAFFGKRKEQIEAVLNGNEELELSDYSHLSETALQTLNLLFSATVDGSKDVVIQTGRLFWEEFFSDRDIWGHHREGKSRDAEQEQAYLKWLAEYLLTADEQTQAEVMSELLNFLPVSDKTNALLTNLVLCQDLLKRTQSFWRLWNALFDFVKRSCDEKRTNIVNNTGQRNERYYGGELDEVVTTYLLAFPYWERDARSWHTLGEKDSSFFMKAAVKLGYHPGTIYSVARILNTIGYRYLDDGMIWLAEIVRNNPHLRSCPLQVNTEYYLEEYAQRFVKANRSKMKRSQEMRKDLLEVLGFLVERGSTYGYMLRESIS